MLRIDLNYPSLNKDWSMQFMEDSNYDTLLDQNVEIYRPDGQPLLVLLKRALTVDNMALAWSVLKSFNARTENRSTASGIEAVPRIKTDGTESKTTRVPKGWEVVSGIIGYFERNPRFPYCHACAWNAQNPERFLRTVPLLQQCSELFSKHVPGRYAVQKEYVERTHSDFIIPGTVYTTVTVNKNFRTAAHLDAGDLAAGFSNMAVIKQGVTEGGNLVLPNWRLAVKLDHGDLVMFDAHEYHGNTKLLTVGKGSVRCSLVMYYREKMTACLSTGEELEFAKNRKLGDKLYD